MGEIGRMTWVGRGRQRAVLVASALLMPMLWGCGKDAGEAEEASAEATAESTAAMDAAAGDLVAEDVLVDDMMDESATDRIAEMAPPADPMMEMPAAEPGQ